MCEYEWIADRVASKAEQPVLDWGCGSGQMTALLREREVKVESFDYRRGEQLHEITLDAADGATAWVAAIR